jgi:hypothetical protein
LPAAAAIAVVVVLGLLVATKRAQKIERSSTPVQVSTPAGMSAALSANVTGVFTGPTIELEYCRVPSLAVHQHPGGLSFCELRSCGRRAPRST